MPLDRLHARLVRSLLLQRFTAFTRVLLAVGFVPPGLKKLTGEPFTQLPVTHPVGHFFDAFFQAQELYVFVGVVQVAAALLLLHPRTATLGAVLFAPVIFTITVVTWSIGFAGTEWITLLMSLACVYLLCWDYDRLKGLLPLARPRGAGFGRAEYARQAALWGAAGAAAAGAARALNAGGVRGDGFAVAAVLPVLGAAFGLAVAWHARRLPASSETDAAQPP